MKKRRCAICGKTIIGFAFGSSKFSKYNFCSGECQQKAEDIWNFV